jgi:hypothetical protein
MSKKKQIFYKYTCIETALKIIASGKVKFSSPDSFNDPFEFQFHAPDVPKKIKDLMDEEIKSNTGVFCTSQNNTKILMWSHYSDNHKGVVLGFALDEKIYLANEMQQDGIECVYRENFFEPDINHFKSITTNQEDELSKKKFDDLMYGITKTKHIDWSYEEEIRFFKHFKESEKIGYEDWRLVETKKISKD